MAQEIEHACSVCPHVLDPGEEYCPEHPDASLVSLLVDLPEIVRADSLHRGDTFRGIIDRDTWIVEEVTTRGIVWVTRASDGKKECFAGCADVEVMSRKRGA